jgi:hypothetical protein
MRIAGSLAAFKMAANSLLTFRSSRGVPMVLVKTSPESFHAPPAFSRSFFCAIR